MGRRERGERREGRGGERGEEGREREGRKREGERGNSAVERIFISFSVFQWRIEVQLQSRTVHERRPVWRKHNKRYPNL
jgi:hypothetical protein